MLKLSGMSRPQPWVVLVHVLTAAAVGYAVPWQFEGGTLFNLFTIYFPFITAMIVAAVAAIQSYRADDSWFIWTICSAVTILLNLINLTFLFAKGIPFLPKIILFAMLVATIMVTVIGKEKSQVTKKEFENWNQKDSDDPWNQ
jgi:predicted lysophospholipase L1 biosynthesis ABC-type transport system permease subunit